MRDTIKHHSVNWINGMKINKDHFIAQDNACKNALHDGLSLNVSPVRFGLLPPATDGEETFKIKATIDNQKVLRVSVLACDAITPGGVRINISSTNKSLLSDTDGVPATSIEFTPSSTEIEWLIVLTINPFERIPAGSPDVEDNPPRFPYVTPVYKVHLVPENQANQYYHNPYALIVGKIVSNASEFVIDEDYIPPCYSISAHPDLVSLYSEIDQYLGQMEQRSSAIVQKIFRKNQQNEISELVMFLCDRVMLFLSQSIISYRWLVLHESPVALFAIMASMARVMKNSIDMRAGSGKEEMMNYLCEWCELKQGELESMLSNIASMRYDNNQINQNIEKVVSFVKITSRLFETLSKLDFIGKRKESGIFVKEEPIGTVDNQVKARRRFFG